MCTKYAPVACDAEVNVDDVVFCEISPGTYFAHKVLVKEASHRGYWYTNSNIREWVSGYRRIDQLYGKVVETYR